MALGRMFLRGDRATFSRRQRFLIGLNVLAMILVAAAILGGVWYLASLPQFRHRWDLTKEQAFTLTPLTVAVLNGLEKDVEVILIFEMAGRYDILGNAAAEQQVGDYVLDLLREYEIRSRGRIRIEDLDRNRDNLRVGEVFEEIGLRQTNIVIVRSGDSRKVLLPDDLAVIDRGRVSPVTDVVRRAEIESFQAEGALTAAVIEVTEGRKPVACFLTGREEAQITNTGPDGIYAAAAVLRNNNFDVREINLGLGGTIPEDCDVLVVPGPVDPYGAEEMAEIERYLRRGGAIFLALNPYSSESFDAKVLPAFGVSLDRSTVILWDPGSGPGSGDEQNLLFLAIERFSSESRITRSLEQNDYAVMFRKSGALNVAEDLAGADIQILAFTPTDVWGDVHPPDKFGDFSYEPLTEKRGQRIVGLSSEAGLEYPESKMVLFGDTFFYSNHGISEGARGNLLLFVNSINWLAERELQLEIGPKVPFESRVDLLPAETRSISFYVLAVIPAAAVALGIMVWWFRRR